MKLCKDCKHMNRDLFPSFMDWLSYRMTGSDGNEGGTCDHPNNFFTSLVDGKKYSAGCYPCRNVRSDYSEKTCGTDARWFEPKDAK